MLKAAAAARTYIHTYTTELRYEASSNDCLVSRAKRTDYITSIDGQFTADGYSLVSGPAATSIVTATMYWRSTNWRAKVDAICALRLAYIDGVIRGKDHHAV